MSIISSTSPKGLLFNKFLTFNNEWFERRQKEFQSYKSNDGEYHKESDTIRYNIFRADWVSNDIPDEILKNYCNDSSSPLWETFNKGFQQYCWDNSIEVNKRNGFCEILPLAIAYFNEKIKVTGDFYVLDLDEKIEKLFNEIKDYVADESYDGEGFPNIQTTYISTFENDYQIIFNNLLMGLKEELLSSYSNRINALKKGLSLSNQLIVNGLNLQKCQEICDCPIFGKTSLNTYYYPQDNNKSAAEFFANLINNNPKMMNGEFNIQGYGTKSILYNLLYTIETTINIVINRDLIEKNEWIIFANSHGDEVFNAKASRKHPQILPTIKNILSST